MSRRPFALVAAAALFALTAAAGPVSAAQSERGVATVNVQVASVRAATARFHSVDAALAAGYVNTHECVPGMGVHFVNIPAIMDPALDETMPEILVYWPTSSGLKLAAVEYLTVDADQDIATVDDVTLFGRQIDGPMLGHNPGDPVHYDLHAWIWQPNPLGMFISHNPETPC